LAAAVNAGRGARMQACIESTTILRDLAGHGATDAQRWLLQQIAEMQYPRFGTSGWRARMGQDFSWRRATAVAQAIVEFVIGSGLQAHPLTIGYDSRINADRVAAMLAEVAAANGLDVHLASRETPSPALIAYITEGLGVAKNAGLVNCTPSHNPVKDPSVRAYLGTEYHGIRYNMPYGGVAPSRATDTIGRRAMELLLEDVIVPHDRARGAVTYFDTLEFFVQRVIADLSGLVRLAGGARGDALAQMRAYWGADDAMVVIDEMHSASRGYLRRACEQLGIRYTVIHGEKDPLLGELLYANPEPPHVRHLQAKVKEMSAQYPRIIGVGFDTDSDRFGVVDAQGNYVMMNQVLPMLADYLLDEAYNGQPGIIIRNVVTTRLLDRIAEEHRHQIIPPADLKAPVVHAAASNYRVALGDVSRQSGFYTHVVPVGFKFIADVMMTDLQQVMAAGEQDATRVQQAFHASLAKLMIAGEESNGMTSRGHTPDKDGLWGAMLTLQMCAVREKPLQEIWDGVCAKYGTLVSVRRDVEAPDVAKKALVNIYLERYADMEADLGPDHDRLMADLIPVYCGGVADEMVEVIYKDRTNAEHYLAVRASGTEPINRIYVESPSAAMRDTILLRAGEELEHQTILALAAAPDVPVVVNILADVELPPEDGSDLPATFNTRVLDAARDRLQAIGGDAAVCQANNQLGARNAKKQNALA
jgi:phosphomannomutase